MSNGPFAEDQQPGEGALGGWLVSPALDRSGRLIRGRAGWGDGLWASSGGGGPFEVGPARRWGCRRLANQPCP